MKKVYAYTASTRKEAEDALKSGMTVPDVSKAMGINQATIYKWINDKKINVADIKHFSTGKHKRHFLSNAEAIQVFEDIKAGGTETAIMKKWNISKNTVERIKNGKWHPKTLDVKADKTPATPATPPVSPISPAEVPEYQMSLKEFRRLLRELLDAFDKNEARVAEYQRVAEKWKLQAGKIQEQLNATLQSMSLR